MKKVFKDIKSIFIFFTLLSIFISLIAIGITFLEGYAIDALLKRFEVIKDHEILNFVILLSVVCLAYFISLIGKYYYQKINNKFVLYISKSITSNLFSQFKDASIEVKQTYCVQDIFKEIIDQSKTIDIHTFIPLSQSISILFTYLAIIIFFAITNWIALVLLLVVLSFCSIIYLIFAKKLKKNSKENNVAFKQLINKLSYYMKRYPVLYFANKEHLIKEFMQQEIYKYYQANYKYNFINSINDSFIKIVLEFGSFLGLVVLGTLYLNQNPFTSIRSIYIFKKVIELSKNQLPLLANNIKVLTTYKHEFTVYNFHHGDSKNLSF
ncbi:ABC transporter transmembrane domain-containing protein [Mycoplasma sp. 394]